MSSRVIFASFLFLADHVAYAQVDLCAGIFFSAPLSRKLQVTSGFNPTTNHYGTDYVAKGDVALAAADGVVSQIAWNAKLLDTKDHRSGSLVKGWGRYVVLNHANGSQTLYAHLEKDSTQSLKIGQTVKMGERLGITDGTGGVSGPHLHLEYSPSGNIFLNSTKVNPDVCVLRRGWLSIESYSTDAKGICQVFVDGKLVGENPPGSKTKLTFSLVGGKHVLRVVAKQIVGYKKAYCSIELDEPFTILDSTGGDIGPGLSAEMEQGQSEESTLRVW